MRAGRTALVGGLMLLVAALTGCVSVPTTGPVERVQGEPPACQNCVNVEVAPPADGDTPLQIVQGYLSAMNNYQGAGSVIRQYLTRGAAETWSPDGGVLIYTGKPVAKGNTVTLDGTRVGTLGREFRTFAVGDQRFEQTFTLNQENGQWRISNPLGGLLVSQNAFANFYQAVNLYFVSNGATGSLVPESIYLPNAGNPAILASSLVKALLRGPSTWLAPAVVTAVPRNTTLKVESVTITSDGVAEVPLSDTVLTLTDPERAQLAAQIVYTLKQVSGVKGVLITVNGSRFRVPQSDANTMVISPAAISEMLDPVPPVAGSQLYVARGPAVHTLAPTLDTETALTGPLAAADSSVQSLAVSVANTDVAAVIADGTRLVSVETTTTDDSKEAKTVLGGVKGLLRPQYSRYGELWEIGEENGRQRLWMSAASKMVPLTVDPEMFAGGRVTAFKISPDGTRMALIRSTAAGAELGLVRISRAAKVIVDGWQVLDTRQEGQERVTQMEDVAWLDATDLLVLGSESKKAAVVPYTISDDALTITPRSGIPDWGAAEMSVELHTQAVVVRGAAGETWRYDGSQWLGLGDKGATALAYPG